MPSWINALRAYNKDSPAWCIPRKGTDMYAEVRKIMEKGEAKPEPKPESAMSKVMNNPDLLGKVKEYSAGREGEKSRRDEKIKEVEKKFDEIKATQKGYERFPKKAMDWLRKEVQSHTRAAGMRPDTMKYLMGRDYFELLNDIRSTLP